MRTTQTQKSPENKKKKKREHYYRSPTSTENKKRPTSISQKDGQKGRVRKNREKTSEKAMG